MIACSPADDREGDAPSDEAALASACTLGVDCPTVKVLSARTYSRAPAKRRSDVTIATQNAGIDLRVFSQNTSRILSFDGTKKVSLAGDAAGDAKVSIDDFYVVEVLSPAGALLGSGAVNYDGVRVAGNPAPLLAPIPAYSGMNVGWTYDAGAIDLTPILPKNTPFRLRISAFDAAGIALTSDVYLKVEDALSPTPTPTPTPAPTSAALTDDPFDPASCTGAPATAQDFASRFAPGGSLAFLGHYKVESRVRDCNAISGCTPWRTNTDAIDMTRQGTDQPPPNADPLSGSTWLSIENGKIYPRLANNTCWPTRQDSPNGQVCARPPESQSELMSLVGPVVVGWRCWDIASEPGHVRCGGYDYVSSIYWKGSQYEWQPEKRVLRGWKYGGAGPDNMPYAYAFVGTSCMRITASLRSGPADGDHSDVEVAALARY